MELRERESVHRSINVDTGQAGSQVMEHNTGSSASLLHSFNKGLLSAGCVLGTISGYGMKIIKVRKIPTFLDRIF